MAIYHMLGLELSTVYVSCHLASPKDLKEVQLFSPIEQMKKLRLRGSR